MKPIQTGLALSATVALFYSFCTLIEVLWPAQFIGFMNALFHGLDFQPMRGVLASPWSDYFFALPVVALWAFAAGVFYAAVHNALGRLQLQRPVRHA